MRQPLDNQPIPSSRIIAGFIVVSLAMLEMFSVPRAYFVLGSLVATTCMICIAFMSHPNLISMMRPTLPTIAAGIVGAIFLYLVFLGGNEFVRTVSPLGIGASNEGSIYSLFASTPILLRLIVFFLDALGFESYFRGILQQLAVKKLGIGSVFIVALVDAAIHFSSLNPLFVVTTFIADSVWGINYYFAKDLSSNILDHFLWDILIFIVIPVS